MTRILVTGASGFIGAALVRALADDGRQVRAAYRAQHAGDHGVAVGDLGAGADWSAALDGMDAVVHLASPAHAKHPDAYLRAAIVDATAALCKQAETAGVRRFIYMSSIKAAVARTHSAPARESEAPAPEDAYGRAKLEAEAIVLAHGALRPVVLRPPLVHAPDAKANFGALLRLAASPLPLPLDGLRNRRSLISRDSLIGAIRAVLAKGDAPAGVFHVADAPSLSTGDIVAALRRGFGRAPNLMPAPFATLLPRQLTESLEVDAANFSAAYVWVGADTRAALAATAAAFKAAA
ncbi:MAG: NAD-dependent epimerase/dehydratase family protein [Hyphomonadaceae bacterium]